MQASGYPLNTESASSASSPTMSGQRFIPDRHASRPGCRRAGSLLKVLLPPGVAAPLFAIRKPAVVVFTIDAYVAISVMSADQPQTLRDALASRTNILVADGTPAREINLDQCAARRGGDDAGSRRS